MASGERGAILVKLRPYTPADEDAALELWRRTWQKTYPDLDFDARLPWWRERWCNTLVPNTTIVVAERNDAMLGLVTVDARTRYLDQIAVAPEAWGSGVAQQLLAEAKRISPSGLDIFVNQDNLRAIGFYQKHGFSFAGEDVNPMSGRPVNKMIWRP
ncbi:MAG TPA: GNAT family N-acetyltransferase [Xanthobacteraceae bacterium]|jgi:putative acetyltransferase